ncbi:MAG TPA: hydantoinase/oxoprolinase family protein [Miltoncostaeaceae bacterium]|nr:hydantoinase/oxoprolinase family protein [Miltoncostaeaceae bacterium]
MISAASSAPEGALVGVDVGGTFTDAVVVAGGRLVTAKVPTTPDDQSEAVVAAVLAALEEAGLAPSDVRGFGHGMTVGTNALLEGKGARTSLVATEGFGDLLELRRQTRASLYRLDVHHPAPLIPHERSHEVAERCGPDGVLAPLDPASVARAVEAVRADGAEAVAVGLLFSFAHPGHEREVAAALREALPGVHVSASSEVLPEIREYERLSTTAVDAYLTPVLRSYLERLAERAGEAGLPAPAIMQSSGGVLPIEASAEHAAWTVLSGPAGGVIGAARLAAREATPLALTFDMGGTSCDVALVRDGAPARTSEAVIAGHPLHLPMLDVATVSAGGGSIAWADSGGALRVGPHSAGARPGPAAYRLGGTQPTVTDANLVLGRLPADTPLGGRIRLDPGAARDAVGALAAELGMDLEDCAEGILAVAVQEMVRALRLVSVERGEDPREAVLIAFGGAGPLHACAVADELGVRRVVAPPAAGVLAALGLVMAGERRDYVQTVLALIDAGEDLAGRLAPLAERAGRELPGAPQRAAADCRYSGQSHSLTVDWDPAAPEAELAEAFHAAHAARYGDAEPGRPVEAVSLRLAAERPGTDPELPDDELGPAVEGPAVIPMDGATCWVAEGWSARTDPIGGLLLERGPDERRPPLRAAEREEGG